jgi:hypothetical protein
MMDIQSKFSVNDCVFYAGLKSVQKQFDCPDCLGEKKWTVKSPAGGEYEFDCPRCSASYLSDRSLNLSYLSFEPDVGSLTIGSVRYDSEKGFHYMCVETGVGSGQVYDEHDLSELKAGALEAAKIKAHKKNKSNPSLVKQYDDALRVCDYQLHELNNAGNKQ